MWRGARRAATALVIAPLVVSACGASATSSSSTSATRSTLSPLEGVLGGPEKFKDQERKIEAAVTACMRSKGWQYAAPPANAVMTMSFGNLGDDFRERYGYGLSTRPPIENASPDTNTDPNQAYLASLSEADKAQWTEDLYGKQDLKPNAAGDTGTGGGGGAPAAGGMVAVAGGAIGGCFGEAQTKVQQNDPSTSKAVIDRVQQLQSSMQHDPRMIDAQQKWSACMKTAGFTYAKQEEIFTDLLGRMNKITGNGNGNGDGNSNGAPAPPVGAISGAVFVQNGGPTATTTPAQGTAMATLQHDEIAIAKADHACDVKYLSKVREALERATADQLQAEFPELGKR